MLPTIAPKPVGIWEPDGADSNSNQAAAAHAVRTAVEGLAGLLGVAQSTSPTPAHAPGTPVESDHGPTPVPALPCQVSDGPSWTDWSDRRAAAELCDTCPVAHACLLEALRLDAAARRGEDPYGVRGVWGGVWFQPKLWYRPHGLPDSVLHPIHRRLANRATARTQA